MSLLGYMIRYDTWEKFILASNGSEHMKQLVITHVRDKVSNEDGLIDSFKTGLAVGQLLGRCETHDLDKDDLLRTIVLTRSLDNVPIVRAAIPTRSG